MVFLLELFTLSQKTVTNANWVGEKNEMTQIILKYIQMWLPAKVYPNPVEWEMLLTMHQ
jgi:hypothetical protein